MICFEMICEYFLALDMTMKQVDDVVEEEA